MLDREQVIELIKDLVKKEGTQAAAAHKIGIVDPYMSDLLRGKRNSDPELLSFFGLE